MGLLWVPLFLRGTILNRKTVKIRDLQLELWIGEIAWVQEL